MKLVLQTQFFFSNTINPSTYLNVFLVILMLALLFSFVLSPNLLLFLFFLLSLLNVSPKIDNTRKRFDLTYTLWYCIKENTNNFSIILAHRVTILDERKRERVQTISSYVLFKMMITYYVH